MNEPRPSGSELASTRSLTVAARVEGSVMPVAFLQTIPILRIFSVAKAKEFYVDYLGFTLDWEHHFDDNSPAYIKVSRQVQHQPISG